MRKFITFGPALVVLLTTLVTLIAAPAAVRMVGYASTEANIRLAQQSLEQDDILHRINKATRAIADVVEPSVVHIGVNERRGMNTIRVGQGSGWVYDVSGHIVTNAHVVRGAELIAVQFQDGRTVEAELVGLDPTTDVAVIRAKTTEGLFPAQRAPDTDLHQGDRVYAFGSPFGFKFSMSEGIVSGLGRDPRTVIGADGYTNFIQTDAAVNPGNSGGPLVNVDGRVVGMNVAIATGANADGTTEGQSSGISFAIPISTIEAVVDQLITVGVATKGYLGISHPGTDEANGLVLAEMNYRGRGVAITMLAPDGPASKAGLQAGDIITSINGRSVISVPGLRSAITNNTPGDKVSVEVWRSGETKSFQVTLGQLPPTNLERKAALEAAKRFGIEDFVVTADGEIRINGVRAYSRAHRAGVRPGMSVVAVEGRPVSEPDDFLNGLASGGLPQGRNVTITVSDGASTTSDVVIEPR